MPAPADFLVGARFLAGIPPFLRRPLSSDLARSIVRRRLAWREADFLAMVRSAVLGRLDSPYRLLLRLAGCEYGDLERLVATEGLEGALGRLFRSGVYLSVAEFKGRRPVVRGSATFAPRPADLRNPAATVHLLAESSGSRGPSTPVPMDLRSNWEQTVNRRLTLEARGALGWRLALWSVPGGMEAMIVLRFAASGKPPERWFSPVDPAAAELHARYRLSARLIQAGALLAGRRLPAPHWAPLDDPRPLLDWLRGVRQAGQVPHVKTIPGAALRLGQAAEAEGEDLAGVRFTLTGEPLTPQKRALLARLGADAVSDYGSVECGAISEWCAAPIEADEMHLFEDLHAVIQAGQDNPAGLPPRALLMTSLRPSAPLLFFNLSLGDQAVLSRRECGCPLAAAGWRTLLHDVRSFEKLSVDGVSLLDADLVGVLEEVLPARFGGSSADYQLVERTADEGPSTLTLLVDTSVGRLDERALLEAFLAALGSGSGADRISALQLRQAGQIRVERRSPHAQASGKVLHVHLASAADRSGRS